MTDQMRDRVTVGPADGWKELLVPFDGSRGAEEVLRRACRTARRDNDDLSVLCMVKLPPDDPSASSGQAAWDDPNLDLTAMASLARAQQICREEGVAGVFKLNYARNLADAIIAEARRSGVVLICMSLDEYDEHQRGETALMSETVQSVLATAPCSVLLEDPSAERITGASSRR
jgi:nucleotide-binding universal stress UspA family protein